MGPGIAIATDLKDGFVDRFRALPTSRWAYLLGHLVAELAASALAVCVLTATGLVVGGGSTPTPGTPPPASG